MIWLNFRWFRIFDWKTKPSTINFINACKLYFEYSYVGECFTREIRQITLLATGLVISFPNSSYKITLLLVSHKPPLLEESLTLISLPCLSQLFQLRLGRKWIRILGLEPLDFIDNYNISLVGSRERVTERRGLKITSAPIDSDGFLLHHSG